MADIINIASIKMHSAEAQEGGNDMKETRKIEDSKLTLITKLAGNTPEGSKYSMVLPETTDYMRNNMGCSAALRHLHDVLDRKSLVFSVHNSETGRLASTIICTIVGDGDAYTYRTKMFEKESEDLSGFCRECVVFAVKTLMRNKRIHDIDYARAHAAYNRFGCAAIQA